VNEGYYDGPSQGGVLNQLKSVGTVSLKKRIDFAVARAEETLAKVKEAKEIFDRNPDLERLLDIMQQSHF
jgi:hypothetical protein